MEPTRTRKRLVIKIGTSSLTNAATGAGIRLAILGPLVEVLTELRREHYDVILVTSGAVGVGSVCLGLKQRPSTIAEIQAVAAVGQGRLIRLYDDLFSALGQPIAQVLLTRDDMNNRKRYVNAHHTFEQLLTMGVIPIVNENDTVAIDELKFGDNDSLSALVASMVQADWLILLTDVDRLYSADPTRDPEAEPIDVVPPGISLQVNAESNGKSGWGTGGMATKLMAARIATAAGVTMVIMSSQHPDLIPQVLEGESIGTRFDPDPSPASARKQWIAYGLVPEGSLILDEGAVHAIAQKGRSLLPAGILQVVGVFGAGAAVSLCDPEEQEIARGIVNYDSTEVDLIRGKQSDEIEMIVGYQGASTVVHRDDLALLEICP